MEQHAVSRPLRFGRATDNPEAAQGGGQAGVKAAIKTERGQPCPRVESEKAIRADKAVRAPDAMDGFVETETGSSDSLPDGWQLASFGYCAEVLMGQSPAGDTYNTTGEGVP